MNYVCRYVISTLKRFMPEDRLSNVQGVALTADGRGAVFDVPSAEVQDYLQGITFLNCFTSI
jgi:ATP-dependent RNA helicase DDX21